MNLPNKITLARIVFIPVYCALMSRQDSLFSAIAGAIFIALSLTDLLDGHIARKRGMVTDLGKFMDPVADKLLVLAAISLFVARSRISVYALILIFARELAVLSLRAIAANKQQVIAADSLGKLKTITQMVSISAMHFELLLPWVWLEYANNAVFYISLALTAISGGNYIYQNLSAFSES
ncbi:MAG: CDP-diacylglycerol--glycerol-3-phosphate 3-phosphatidyltransferase [Eubacteriaceae bacterium]|nr:CDP-diacylglycerol--glycerol-3-phosphate 3-phosphatidyltransferase [Eubacteriaceae bacterium]